MESKHGSEILQGDAKGGPITIVTLSRPEVYNALHIDAHFELNKVFDDFSADPEQ